MLFGPPGTGKSMLAQRLPGVLPGMDEDEAIEAAAVASIEGRFDARSFRRRPFRAPHHSASAAALVGGGCQFSELLRLCGNNCDDSVPDRAAGVAR